MKIVNNDWIEITDVNDFLPLVSNPVTQMYLILSQNGILKIGYPYSYEEDDNGNITSITFDCWASGGRLVISNITTIIAIKPIDIPQPLLNQIKNNKRGKNSYVDLVYSHKIGKPEKYKS